MKTTLRFYVLLGVEQTASAEEIKKAYKKLAQQYHPDRNKDQDAANLFIEITKAYNVLMDESTRRQYDLSGSENVTSNSSQVFSRISGEFLKFIENTIKARVTNNRAPVFGDILKNIKIEITDIENNKTIINKALEHANTMFNDVVSTSTVNVYSEILNDYIRKLKADLANFEHHTDILKGAVDVLSDYKRKSPEKIEDLMSIYSKYL